MRYLKFRAISNFFLCLLSISGLIPCKMPLYLKLRYLELLAVSN